MKVQFMVYMLWLGLVSASIYEAIENNSNKIYTSGIAGLVSYTLCKLHVNGQYCAHWGVVGITGTSLTWDLVENRDSLSEKVSPFTFSRPNVLDTIKNSEITEVLGEGLKGLKRGFETLAGAVDENEEFVEEL